MPPTQIQKIGLYQIQAEVRRDSFSITYQAVDTNKKQVLTLRVLDEELANDPLLVRRFIGVGQETARLQHDNIVKVYETGEYDGYYYTTGEFISGNTLLSLLIQRNKLLSSTEVASIVQQIATALDYAHEQGFLHLDLNFRHILITEDRRALLVDFGLDELRRYVYETNESIEKLHPIDLSVFSAPEQVRGDFDIDYRADIYSLGVLVYAMLVGKLPFEASDSGELQREILEEAPPAADSINPRVPERVANVLNKALAKEPAQRYGSAGEFAKVLTQSLLWAAADEGMAEAAAEDEADDLPGKQPLLRRGCMISAVSVALVLLAALVFAAVYARPILMGQLAMLGFGNDSDGSITTTTAIATPIQPTIAVTELPTAAQAIAQQGNISESSAVTLASTPELATEVAGVITATEPSVAIVESSPATATEPLATVQATDQAADQAKAGEATATTLPATAFPTLAETPAVPTNTDTALPTAAPKPIDTPTPAPADTASVSLVLTPTLAITAAIQSANVQPVDTPEVVTDTLTDTVTDTATDTVAVTPTATITPTSTTVPSATPLPTETATATVVPTSTSVPTPTVVPTETPVPIPTLVPTETMPPTPTAMPTDTVTPEPTTTPTPVILPTDTLAPTAVNTNTPVPTATPLPTETSTPVPTATMQPTDTATALPTATQTAIATVTSTPLPTYTSTETATSTTAPTATTTNTPEPTATFTVVPTEPPTPTSLPVATATELATPTTAPTATATNTPEPTATFTVVPTEPPTPTSPPPATATPLPIPPSFDLTNLRRPLADGTARMRGTGQPGSTVQVLVDNVVAGTTVVRANGAWALAVALGTPGSYQIHVQAVNRNGAILQSNTRPVTVIVPTPTPVPTPTVTVGTVQLVGPGEGTAGTGVIDFQWSTNFKPDAGSAFELVFWKEGQNPLASGFGLAAPTTGTKTTVNLSSLDDKLGNLLEPGNYKWGILLVRVSPYQRVQFMGQARTFRFDRSGSNDGGGSGSSQGGGQNSGE